ncbi:MAG: hypothetical protein JWR86_1203 [Enterovirga sp.]|jgi:curli biogenesis system outer membrane secretion channel CsgG|nr:hypothetical protein [Enterovirga sp.]
MMRARWIVLLAAGMACATPAAFAQSAATPTPGTTAADPGAAATQAVTNPTRPPAEVAPSAKGTSGQVQYSPPPAIDPAAAQTQSALSPAEVRELLEASKATAVATRESVDYIRVMPDILTQILAKLDKLENKLDKIEDALKEPPAPPPPPKRR